MQEEIERTRIEIEGIKAEIDRCKAVVRDFPQEPTRLIGAVRTLRMLNKRLAERRAVLRALQTPGSD